jgi:hypothetical protein
MGVAIVGRFDGAAMGCVKRQTHKRKPHGLLRNCGVYLVAWGRIELPTRGFSTQSAGHFSLKIKNLHLKNSSV